MKTAMLKCNVRMLPTEKATSHISMRNSNSGGLSLGTLNFTNDLNKIDKSNNNWTSQHLYFISDRDIKEGDYFLSDYGSFVLRNCEGGYSEYPSSLKDNKKIEATSDPSMNISLIPQSFVEKFVESQGEIKEVMIETILLHNLRGGEPEFETVVNTRKDNTVIIHKIKDSWTREEVIELIKRNTERLTNQWLSNDIEWIEQNL